MTLQEAIEEVKLSGSRDGVFTPDHIIFGFNGALSSAIATILNAVVKGELRTQPEPLEEQVHSICASLGPVHGKLLAEGYEGSAAAVMEAGVKLNSLARRVIAAEKLAGVVNLYLGGASSNMQLQRALTAYLEASK
jgi:hypothetical protein